MRRLAQNWSREISLKRLSKYLIFTVYPEEKTLLPEARLESKLAAKVIQILEKGEAGKIQIARSLDHETVSGELNKQIKQLLTLELIEMTPPDTPNSRLQKYRLTTGLEQALLQAKSN